jgi:hypothetical protein
VSSSPNNSPATANIDFRDKNAVERFLETKKFRHCSNLQCEEVKHPQMHMLYMPVCLEGRFAREGFAQHIEMPMGNRPLSPITYRSIPQWAPLISCPRDCRGYRNQTLARVLALFRRHPHGEGTRESTQKEGRWKWWIAGVLVPIAIGVLALLQPEVRQRIGLDKPKPDAVPSAQGLPPQTSPASSQSPEIKTGTKTQSKSKVIDNSNNIAGKNVTGDRNTGNSLTIQQNSGGVNVQQTTSGNNSPIINSPITIGVVPKRISPQDVASISRFLSGAKSKARIKMAIDQNNNARAFVDDFYEAVKDGGWPMEDAGVNEFIGFSSPGKKFQGVVIIVKGEPLKPNETVYLTDSDPLFYIAQMVDALKLPHILRREPNQPDDLIIVQFEGGLPD